MSSSTTIRFDDLALALSFDEGGWLIHTRSGELSGRAETIHEARAAGLEAFAAILQERHDQVAAALEEVLGEMAEEEE